MIPKVIYQSWETKNLSEYFLKNIEKWKDLNPEYKFKLYDSKDRRELISSFGKRYLDVYDKIIAGAFKCDFWRYIILYLYGGIATDLDLIPINSIDDFIKDDDFMICSPINNVRSQSFYLITGFMGIVPKHPIMLWCIERICNIVENNKPYLRLCDFTGPGNFGRGVNIFLNRYELDSFVGFKYKNICFLNFNEKFNNELIYNDDKHILAQNKNGNETMIKEYNILSTKHNAISWLDSKNTF
jgi:mannosyltransferase OCH1-like enzyme